jgi:hypothetical protein
MIRINFSQKEIETLRFERFHNSSIRVQQKMEALFLKSKELPHSEICRICEISKPTLITYLREFQEGGVRRLKENTRYKGNQREVKLLRKQYA